MREGPILYWIRKDFRIQDNAALHAIIELGRPVVPVYLDVEDASGSWPLGGASRWWLHRALEDFSKTWEGLGGRLIIRSTDDALECIQNLLNEVGAAGVVWNRRYEAPGRELDAEVKRSLRDDGFFVESFKNALLVEPHTASTGQGKPYKVYTPFWRSIKDRPLDPVLPIAVDQLRFPKAFPDSLSISDLKLLPDHPWIGKLDENWTVGEAAAQTMLEAFLDNPIHSYDTDRDLPAEKGTSRLSPYLHWGHVGPRQVAAAVHERFDLRQTGPQVYMKEIYWREFAYNVLYHFPETANRPLRKEFEQFPWSEDEALQKAWRWGKTGYPIVDAGMRQLYATGWMHNRVRMIVASLLVKHLLQPWLVGARWFWDTLVDADLASNTLGWQWSAGCGADAAPYFRIFNPITQGEKFDPDGDYVRRWVPEIAQLPDSCLHQPWTADKATLIRAGVELGKDYPLPVIEHSEGRARALAAFGELKNG